MMEEEEDVIGQKTKLEEAVEKVNPTPMAKRQTNQQRTESTLCIVWELAERGSVDVTVGDT